MQQFFFPRSVAVIGVSPRPVNMAKNIVKNLLDFGFPGPVYAVGPHGDSVHGIPILPDVAALPAGVELAALLTPAGLVPGILEECGRKGIRRVLISSGGFSEYSASGQGLQGQVLAIARRYGMRVLGPNCIGIVNLENGLVLPFTPMEPKAAVKGHNSAICQSGGVTMRCSSLLSQPGVGYSKVISVGNKADVDEVDLLRFLAADPDTHAIFLYLESVARGQDFLEAARACPKPIAVLKANRFPQTGAIARSHTAALANDDRVVDAALRQAGMLRVRRMEDFLTCAKACALPPCRGDNLVVISMSGGMAVLGADEAAAHGFALPDLPEPMRRELEDRRRGGVIRLTNPVDFGDIYDREAALLAIARAVALPEVAAVAASIPLSESVAGVALKGPSAAEAVAQVATLIRKYGKPVVMTMESRGSGELVAAAGGLPLFFPTLEEGIEALAYSRELGRLSAGKVAKPHAR